MKNVVWIVALWFVLGCADPGHDTATTSFQAGEKAEQAGQLESAKRGYEAAVKECATCEPGQKAAARLVVVNEQLTKKRQELRAEEEARKKKIADDAAAEAKRADEACKAKKWVTFCSSGGGFLDGATKAECEKTAKDFELGFKTDCAACRCADEVEGAH